MSGDGERDDRGPPLPLPRFQAAPQTIGEDEKRKPSPLPRHVVKQILADQAEAMRSLHPRLLEMERRRRLQRHLARWPKGKDG